nr:hypothetical protein [Pedobacter panaciterrae]
MKVLMFFLLQVHFCALAQVTVDDPDIHLSQAEKEIARIGRLNYTTNKIGVNVTPPTGFSLLKTKIEAPKNTSSIDYAFVNKDSTIFITIGLMPRDSIDYEQSRKSFKMFLPQFKNYEPNDQWLINYNATVDSSSFRPRIFTLQLLKKFNAEGGVEFKKKKSNNLYLNKYVLERIIILNKRLRGICEIHYFKVPDAKFDVEHKIKTAYKMIRYK